MCGKGSPYRGSGYDPAELDDSNPVQALCGPGLGFACGEGSWRGEGLQGPLREGGDRRQSFSVGSLPEFMLGKGGSTGLATLLVSVFQFRNREPLDGALDGLDALTVGSRTSEVRGESQHA